MGKAMGSKPGSGGAMTAHGQPDTLLEIAPGEIIEGAAPSGLRLLKYDSFGQPVYVTPKQYREILGEPKKRSHRKRNGTKKGKRR
jgi:hypothetical protein